MYDFDELLLLRGDNLVINDQLSIHHPTLEEVYCNGEEKYYGMVQAICATPHDYMVQLDDIGVDYTNISEIEMFVMMSKNLSINETKIIFGDVDFSKMKIVNHTVTGELALYDSDKDLMIDNVAYTLITEFLRKIHGLVKNEEYGGNELTKRILIDEARRNQEIMLNKGNGFKSILAPYISAITNCSESNYDIHTVWTLPMYVLFDSIKRINKIKISGYMLNGAYSGWVDAKQFNKNDLDWSGELK
ncbi:MAG: hypothetical protein RR370_01845 [Synergistaceae bacterium]